MGIKVIVKLVHYPSAYTEGTTFKYVKLPGFTLVTTGPVMEEIWKSSLVKVWNVKGEEGFREGAFYTFRRRMMKPYARSMVPRRRSRREKTRDTFNFYADWYWQ